MLTEHLLDLNGGLGSPGEYFPKKLFLNFIWMKIECSLTHIYFYFCKSVRGGKNCQFK